MMPNIPNLIITTMITYYITYLIRVLFNKKSVQQNNKKIDELRNVAVKTLDEQKKFLDLKFPKGKKEKYFIKTLFRIIKSLLLFIPIAYIIYKLIQMIPYEIPLWTAITFIFVFPIIFNLILTPFHLENENIVVMLRGKWFNWKK